MPTPVDDGPERRAFRRAPIRAPRPPRIAGPVGGDYQNLDSVEACKEELTRQIEAVEGGTTVFDSPLSAAVTIDLLRRSGVPGDERDAKLLEAIAGVQSELAYLRGLLSRPAAAPISVSEVERVLADIPYRFPGPRAEPLPAVRKLVEEAQNALRPMYRPFSAEEPEPKE